MGVALLADGMPAGGVAGSVVADLLRSAAGALDFVLADVFEAERRKLWTVMEHSSPPAAAACSGGGGDSGSGGAPTLFIYSYSDHLADSERIRQLARSLAARGRRVLERPFADTPHVGHLRSHPAEYRDQVRHLLDLAVQCWRQREEQRRVERGVSPAEAAAATASAGRLTALLLQRQPTAAAESLTSVHKYDISASPEALGNGVGSVRGCSLPSQTTQRTSRPDCSCSVAAADTHAPAASTPSAEYSSTRSERSVGLQAELSEYEASSSLVRDICRHRSSCHQEQSCSPLQQKPPRFAAAAAGGLATPPAVSCGSRSISGFSMFPLTTDALLPSPNLQPRVFPLHSRL